MEIKAVFSVCLCSGQLDFCQDGKAELSTQLCPTFSRTLSLHALSLSICLVSASIIHGAFEFYLFCKSCVPESVPFSLLIPRFLPTPFILISFFPNSCSHKLSLLLCPSPSLLPARSLGVAWQSDFTDIQQQPLSLALSLPIVLHCCFSDIFSWQLAKAWRMDLNIERFDFPLFFCLFFWQIKPYLVFNLGSQSNDITKCLTLEECSSLWMRASMVKPPTTIHSRHVS